MFSKTQRYLGNIFRRVKVEMISAKFVCLLLQSFLRNFHINQKFRSEILVYSDSVILAVSQNLRNFVFDICLKGGIDQLRPRHTDSRVIVIR